MGTKSRLRASVKASFCIAGHLVFRQACRASPARMAYQLQMDRFGSIHACVFLLFLVAGGASENPCDPTLNYFPTAAEIGVPVQKTVVLPNGKYSTAACTGTDNCAFPAVWSSASQHGSDILTSLGTDYDVDANGVFKVAMKAYGGDTVNPSLYFIPQSPLLTAGADVSACVAAASTPAARRILAPASYTVTTPGTWYYSIKRGSDTITSPKVGNAGKLEVAGWPSEGESCALIVTTVSNYSISNQPVSFPASMTSTRKVCWYRNNGQARANLTFSQCIRDDGDDTNIQLNATASNITPAAQYLTQNGAAVTVNSQPVLLFQPVVQVWGYYAQDLSSGPTATTATTSTATRRLRQDNSDVYMATPQSASTQEGYINQYYFVPTNSSQSTFSVASGGLQEGYYRLSAKVSVMTVLPNLVDLQGVAIINQTDVSEVAGYTEYMGWTIINGSDAATPLIGIQKNSTMPALYSISATNTSTALTFSWQFFGVQSSQVCYVDNKVLPTCVSPTNVAVSANDNSTHVFTVVFADVCGNTKNATFNYSAATVSSITPADYVASTDTTPTTTTITGTPVKRATTAASSVGPISTLGTAPLAVLACLIALML